MAAVTEEKEKIPISTLFLWLMTVRLANVFHVFAEFDTPAGHAAWIGILLAAVWVGIGTAVAYGLYRTFPGQSLAEALERYTGTFVGKVISTALAWYFLHQAAICVRSLTDSVTSAILPRTPSLVLEVAVVVVVVFAVRGGIGVVGRSAIPIAIGMFVAVGFISVFIIQELRLGRFLPILGPGPGPIVATSVYVASLATHVVLLLMFLGSTETPKHTAWLLQVQNVLIHVFIAFLFALVVGTMSFVVSQNKVFEFLSLVRFISVGEFIQRIDPLLMAGWVSTSYAAVAAYFLASLMATRTVLGLKDYRALTIPMGVLVVLLCRSMFANPREEAEFLGFGGAATPYYLLFIFVLPLVLLPVFYWRHRASSRTSPRA